MIGALVKRYWLQLLVVVANILIFAAILKVRGNMARLVDRLRH